MKVKYHGISFGRGYAGLTDGVVYECVGVDEELQVLYIVDDSEDDYMYGAKEPCCHTDLEKWGTWEIIEDDAEGTLRKLIFG